MRFAPGAMVSPCDDITSGEASAVCAVHDARPAFAALRRAQTARAEARANGEVDQSGSAAGAFVVDKQTMQDDDLAAMLRRPRDARPPVPGTARLRTATARVDAVLPEPMAQPSVGMPGMVTADGIRAARRACTAYRDAWGRFAAIACPGWGAAGAEAWVSLKRADMLEHLLSDRG